MNDSTILLILVLEGALKCSSSSFLFLLYEEFQFKSLSKQM